MTVKQKITTQDLLKEILKNTETSNDPGLLISKPTIILTRKQEIALILIIADLEREVYVHENDV